jgi:uncharacterized protein
MGGSLFATCSGTGSMIGPGKISLPIPEPELTWLRELRQGRHSKQDALDRAEALEHEITGLLDTSPLTERADQQALDRWLESVHRRS